MTEFSIRLLQGNEANRLGETMGQAFFDDPIMRLIEPDESKRLAKSRLFMSSGIAYCARWGAVFTEDQYRGGAAWLTPGNTSMTAMRTLRSGTWQMPFRMGFGSFSRFVRLSQPLDKAHKEHLPGDHWYLMMLGIHPDHQGAGLGSALLDIGVSKAAKAGLPVYLETLTEADVEFYLKRGFAVVSELTVKPDLSVWAMIKQPN